MVALIHAMKLLASKKSLARKRLIYELQKRFEALGVPDKWTDRMIVWLLMKPGKHITLQRFHTHLVMHTPKARDLMDPIGPLTP